MTMGSGTNDNTLGEHVIPKERLSTDIQIVSQCIDYIRFGPLTSEKTWDYVQQRFDYLDLARHNFYGKYYVDLTGDNLETIRLVENMDVVIDWLRDFHWTRLDVAIDVVGLDIETVARPGTVIMNGGKVETIYSHHLKKRGEHDVFIRVYDAFAAGHDCQPGQVRLEVEFKGLMPDAIKSTVDYRYQMFNYAVQHIIRRFAIPMPNAIRMEIAPPKRLVAFPSEGFYKRYGRRIIADIEQMGLQQFFDYVRECRKEVENGHTV